MNTLYEAIEKRKAEYVFMFAQSRKMKGRLHEIEDALIQIGDAEWLYKFALEYPEVANTEKIQDALIDCCIKYEPKSIKAKLRQEKKLNIQTPFEWLYYFAMDISKADRLRIQTVIGNGIDARAMFYYAKDIPNADIEFLAESISKTSNAEWIFKYARNIKDLKDYSMLQAGLVKCNDYEYVQKFAKFVKQADLLQMQKDMINNKYNIKDVIDFSKNFQLSFKPIAEQLLNEYVYRDSIRSVYYETNHYVYNIIRILSEIIENEEIDVTEIATTLSKTNLDDFIHFAQKIPYEKLLEIKNLEEIKNEIENDTKNLEYDQKYIYKKRRSFLIKLESKTKNIEDQPEQ